MQLKCFPVCKCAFDFVLDYLYPLEVKIKPMFGCHAIYVDSKIMFITRKKPSHENSNGIWIATSYEHHGSLKKEFPSLQSVHVLNDGKGETGWRLLHEAVEDFESSAIRLCELIKEGDQRIGKFPKRKKKKSAKSFLKKGK